MSLSSGIPFGLWFYTISIFADDREYGPDDLGLSAWGSSVTEGYFGVLGTRLLAGREFNSADTPEAPGTVILNEFAAERFWPDENPIGRRIRFQRVGGGTTLEVIGIAETGPYMWVLEPPGAAIFRPLRQASQSRTVLTIHASVDPLSLVPQIRQVIKEINPAVPLFDIKTAGEHVEGSLYVFRMGAEIATALGVMALILAAAGLYGVTTFRVGQRRREMGIRLALGARQKSLLAHVLGGSLRLTAVGIIIGSILALAASGVLTNLVFGVAPWSPVNLLTVAIGLAVVTLFAALMPALSASRADPLESLRTE